MPIVLKVVLYGRMLLNLRYNFMHTSLIVDEPV